MGTRVVNGKRFGNTSKKKRLYYPMLNYFIQDRVDTFSPHFSVSQLKHLSSKYLCDVINANISNKVNNKSTRRCAVHNSTRSVVGIALTWQSYLVNQLSLKSIVLYIYILVHQIWVGFQLRMLRATGILRPRSEALKWKTLAFSTVALELDDVLHPCLVLLHVSTQ